MDGEQIKAARQRAGISREKLAGLLGVSLRTVGNWERGVTIPRDRQHRLADVLGLTNDQTTPLSSISDLDLIAELTRRLSRANREEGEGHDRPAATKKPALSPADQLREPPIPVLHEEDEEQVAAHDDPENPPGTDDDV